MTLPDTPPTKRPLPPSVIWFGVVSLFTDASSELIYPLLPRFLIQVLGASATFVGAVEGIAEATASLFKLYSGRLADRVAHKKAITVAGYGLSSLVRPLIALAWAPWVVLALRFTDRVGKGIRSSPRDAIVAEVTPQDQRGAAYGFHRGMDNTGAVVGPLLGALLLGALHLPLRSVFAWAALPAAVAVAALIFGVRVPPAPPVPAASTEKTFAPSRPLWGYFIALALFTLANASDAFLLLRAADLGIASAGVLAMWTLHNGVKAALSHRFGRLSDRLGRKRVIVVGWIIYALCYIGFGIANAAWQLFLLFGLYGLYYALSEGSERALVADMAGPGRRGQAFGWYHTIIGVFTLPSSLLFGFAYQRFGALTAFTLAAILALVALALLALVVPAKVSEEPR